MYHYSRVNCNDKGAYFLFRLVVFIHLMNDNVCVFVATKNEMNDTAGGNNSVL
jgi:hypothetical protein